MKERKKEKTVNFNQIILIWILLLVAKGELLLPVISPTEYTNTNTVNLIIRKYVRWDAVWFVAENIKQIKLPISKPHKL